MTTKTKPDFSTTANGQDDTERVLFPLMGAYGNVNGGVPNPLTGTRFAWDQDATSHYRGIYMYEGSLWMEGGVTYNFYIRFAANGALLIDGEEVVYGGTDNGRNVTSYGSASFPEAGWHHVKVFFWAWDGSYGPASGIQHGLGWNTNGVTEVSTSNTATEWHRLEDPGDGSLLRTYDPVRSLVELDRPVSRDGSALVVPVSVESYDGDNVLDVVYSTLADGETADAPATWRHRVSTPQTYRFDLLDGAYLEAFEKEIGIYGSHYTNTMMVELGHTLHFAAGSDKNIKLTTKDDLEMFKAYLKQDEDTWLK